MIDCMKWLKSATGGGWALAIQKWIGFWRFMIDFSMLRARLKVAKSICTHYSRLSGQQDGKKSMIQLHQIIASGLASFKELWKSFAKLGKRFKTFYTKLRTAMGNPHSQKRTSIYH